MSIRLRPPLIVVCIFGSISVISSLSSQPASDRPSALCHVVEAWPANQNRSQACASLQVATSELQACDSGHGCTYGRISLVPCTRYRTTFETCTLPSAGPVQGCSINDTLHIPARYERDLRCLRNRFHHLCIRLQKEKEMFETRNKKQRKKSMIMHPTKSRQRSNQTRVFFMPFLRTPCNKANS